MSSAIANQNIVENPGGGIDSVEAWSSYTLPANVENLTLMMGGLTGIGNELANRIVGSSGNDILNGGGGNDWLFGGAGNDTFIYGAGSGHDTIADFHVLTSATAEHDKLILKGYDARRLPDQCGRSMDGSLRGRERIPSGSRA